MTDLDVIWPGHTAWPDWAEGYALARPLGPDDWPEWAAASHTGELWLVVIPLALGRARVAVATPGATGALLDHW